MKNENSMRFHYQASSSTKTGRTKDEVKNTSAQYSQIIFKQQIPPVGMKRIVLVDGSPLLLLLLIAGECLLKGRILIAGCRRLGSGLGL